MSSQMHWFAGADHAGFTMKNSLVEMLRSLGDTVEDLGTNGPASVDYPDFGSAVGRAVVAAQARGERALGLVVCGSGIGISIAANKVAGVRCALIHDAFTAEACRAHNDANVISFGERVIGIGVAESALKIFRATEFAGGRHAQRIDKLAALDASPAKV